MSIVPYLPVVPPQRLEYWQTEVEPGLEVCLVHIAEFALQEAEDVVVCLLTTGDLEENFRTFFTMHSHVLLL